MAKPVNLRLTAPPDNRLQWDQQGRSRVQEGPIRGAGVPENVNGVLVLAGKEEQEQRRVDKEEKSNIETEVCEGK